jgi:Cofilin/tropomyosin-type actin-binding protein
LIGIFLPATAWSEVRDNSNNEVDWLIAGYDNGSKTDITVRNKGNGGVKACAAALLENEPCFGGFRTSTGRFKHFYYAPDSASTMSKGRASMHKNGVLNVMEGCDGECKMTPDSTEADV